MNLLLSDDDVTELLAEVPEHYHDQLNRFSFAQRREFAEFIIRLSEERERTFVRGAFNAKALIFDGVSMCPI